ncbi:MAG: hypothetical protein ACI4IV_04400 [Acutalibacteraceae bacterium]
MALANEFLNYKGLPLVRCGDVLYYGNTADKYVIRLTVLAAEKTADIRSATKVLVELIRSESVTDKKKAAVKSSEKAGLYEAMDIGSVWLKRALSEK